MSKKPDGFVFAGFDSPRYTPTPDQIFDELLAPGLLTEAELRVLLYIVRRTFGWKKELDNISLSQITGGIVRRDGTRLDWGAGVAKSSRVPSRFTIPPVICDRLMLSSSFFQPKVRRTM